jgi:hypothetical protein
MVLDAHGSTVRFLRGVPQSPVIIEFRERAAETRGLAELIEDNFIAETLLEIALQYDELALRAEQRQRRSG